jgi:hypothetical protein
VLLLPIALNLSLPQLLPSVLSCSSWLHTGLARGLLQDWLRYCDTSWKIAGLIPDGVSGMFLWHKSSGRTMAPLSIQPLTEISSRNISLGGGKGGRYVGLTTVPPSWNLGTSTSWNPQGLSRSVMGLRTYPLHVSVPWWWRQEVPVKCQCTPARLCGITSHTILQQAVSLIISNVLQVWQWGGLELGCSVLRHGWFNTNGSSEQSEDDRDPIWTGTYEEASGVCGGCQPIENV